MSAESRIGLAAKLFSTRDAMRRLHGRNYLVTDALGFRLELGVSITSNILPRGRHRTYGNELGAVCSDAPHHIEICDELEGSELAEVIAHEAYHLFYSVRPLITSDEETEAEAFGHLVKRIHEMASRPPSPKPVASTQPQDGRIQKTSSEPLGEDKKE